MGAVSEIQLIIASFIFIFGEIFNGNTLATFALLITEIDRQERETQAKLSIVNEAMHNYNLPKELKRIIRFYIISMGKTHHTQSELMHFLDSIPPSLKERVLLFIFGQFIQENSLFKKVITV